MTAGPAANAGDTYQTRKPVTPDGRAKPRVFLRLLLLLRPHWPMMALGLFLLVLSTPCELFPALVWRFVTDDVVLGKETSPTLRWWFGFGGVVQGPYGLLASAVGWMLVIYLLGELLGTLCTWILSRVAQRFMLGFRNRVYRKIQGQSLSYLQRQRTGDLMSRAMGDVDELQTFVVGSIDTIVGEAILWAGAVVIVCSANWQVAAASLAPLLLVYVLLRVFNRRIKPVYADARDRLGDVSTRLQENLSGLTVIKIFGRERQEAERFEQATGNYYKSQLRAINARSLYFPFARVVGFLSNVAMLGVGGYYLLADLGKPNPRFTLGDVVLFRAYWWRLFGPVQTLARVNDMVQRAGAAGRRIFEVLDAPDELPDGPNAVPLDKVRGAMELRNVTFAYEAQRSDHAVSSVQNGTEPLHAGGSAPGSPRTSNASGGTAAGVGGNENGSTSGDGSSDHSTPRDPTVLRDVSIRIEPGQTVALCGPSGSGKSTVLNLLLRFYDPTAGQVTLDDHDLRSIRRSSFRSHFALVQQETFLFNDSILDNIRYGHAEATMEQVVAAAKAANAHAFIEKLPGGYDTKVGERGVRLSGGQKQRISIARAFLANPTVLLLDEPTSSVEPDSEAAIIAALGRLMAGRTTVLTSHRPSLINQAGQVYVIEDGRVTEQGTVADLRQQEGWFSRFMRSEEESQPQMNTDEDGSGGSNACGAAPTPLPGA